MIENEFNFRARVYKVKGFGTTQSREEAKKKGWWQFWK
jgi:hypothetical protein